MREYLNNGRPIHKLVDRRDTRYLALCPKSLFEGYMTLLSARTPEYELNFSIPAPITHTFSCTGDGNFSGVFA